MSSMTLTATADLVPADSAKWMKLFRATFMFLVFFDLFLAVVALGFPHLLIRIGSLDSDTVTGAMYRSGNIEPIFMRGVGILWLIAAYVQYLGWRDPAGRPHVVTSALVFRFCGGTFEAIEGLFLLPRTGFSDPVLYWFLLVFVIGDYVLIASMVYMLRRAGVKLQLL
jgi:hypothetical protein